MFESDKTTSNDTFEPAKSDDDSDKSASEAGKQPAAKAGDGKKETPIDDPHSRPSLLRRMQSSITRFMSEETEFADGPVDESMDLDAVQSEPEPETSNATGADKSKSGTSGSKTSASSSGSAPASASASPGDKEDYVPQ